MHCPLSGNAFTLKDIIIQDMPHDAVQFLESFFAELRKAGGKPLPPHGAALGSFFILVSSLKWNTTISIPLLQGLTALEANPEADLSGARTGAAGALLRRIDRRYFRLCRVQEELGRLDFKKAPPGVSAEDYIFSRIDFSRYREIEEQRFEMLFPEALTDFDEVFLNKTFGFGRMEIRSVIERSYTKTGGLYKMQRENPLILSIMRTLESSLENTPLFSPDEIQGELNCLLKHYGSGAIQGTELLYTSLVHNLDNVQITHSDGMTTKLFISPQGDLCGTFRPANKPWTTILIELFSFRP